MVTAHPVAGKLKSVQLCAAFVQGAPPKTYGAVFYGVNSTNIDAWRRVKHQGGDWYTIDNAYFDKTRGGMDLSKPGYFRVTKNRFQVEPLKHSSDGKRFAALGLEVLPLRDFSKPGYCLAVEQSPSFMHDIAGNEYWLDERMRLATSLGTAVKFRAWSANKPKIMQTLPNALQGAKYLLTHSSAAAVEAMLVGVQVVVSPMSCMYGVDDTKRLHAFNVLADNQFTVDEIRNGKAWSWLNRDR